MAVEQNATLQDAETALKAGKNSEGERILKQILETGEGEFTERMCNRLHLIGFLSSRREAGRHIKAERAGIDSTGAAVP